MHGIIPAATPGLTLRPPIRYEHDGPEDPLYRSTELWNAQQDFDHRLHEERGMPLPRDAPEDADLLRSWVMGMAFAFLEELVELDDALVQDNADEETVDTLHFVLSLAEKVGLTPTTLGRFEERFDAARTAGRQRGISNWKDALSGLRAEYVRAIVDLKGGMHKWWKNHPDVVDLAPVHTALRTIDHLNLVIASYVFADADAMFQRYMSKVEENHARQEGKVDDRMDYAVTSRQS